MLPERGIRSADFTEGTWKGKINLLYIFSLRLVSYRKKPLAFFIVSPYFVISFQNLKPQNKANQMTDKAAAIPTEEITDEAIEKSFQALIDEVNDELGNEVTEDELEYIPTEEEEIRLADLIR